MNDLLLSNDDLIVLNGDFATGESLGQHVQHIIASHKGEYKQNPLTGVGKSRFINGAIDGALRRDIQIQLEGDGIRLDAFNVTDGQIQIDYS
jgi:hypothetical protein